MPENTRARIDTFIKNIGSKAGTLLKKFAVFFFIIGIILSLIYGIQTFTQEPEWAKQYKDQWGVVPYSYGNVVYSVIKASYRQAGIGILLGGCIGTTFVSFLILGFGQLVDDHMQIRKLMERQIERQGAPESENKKAEAQQDNTPEPQAQDESDDSPEPQTSFNSNSFSMHWPQWTDD